jgi:hypothetical protein
MQCPHILYISLNQEKQDSPVFQTGVSGFACNSYISNSGCFDFYWLVFWDSIKDSPLPSIEDC